jgi:crotonobetainyl-CoA:carnitine CoA-transferase CaiB-like acyl-CoA transferase
MSEESRLPLSGFRIVDMTEVWAGPEAATYMAELGAEVIRVESYPRASQNRPLIMPLPGAPQAVTGTGDQPGIWERATSYHMANHSKLALAVDVAKPEGHELLMKLIATADAYMIGFSAGTAARLRIDYETISVVNPRIVMVSMPGWGERGLYQGFSTIGSGLDAFAGHHYLRSYKGEGLDSNTASVTHSDAVGCLSVSFAIMAALHYRERSGKGQFIDMSQAEALITHLPRQIFEWTMNHRVLEPVGNSDPQAVPHECYPSLEDDTWITIACRTDAHWQALVEALRRPAWALAPELATLSGRLRQRDVIDAKLTEWTRQRSNKEAFDILRAAGVPSGPVYKTIEVLDDPQLAARDFWRTSDHAFTGPYLRTKLPFRLTKQPTEITHPTNLLGEHNRQVLTTLLGYTNEEVDALEAANIIGTSYAKGADVDGKR